MAATGVKGDMRKTNAFKPDAHSEPERACLHRRLDPPLAVGCSRLSGVRAGGGLWLSGISAVCAVGPLWTCLVG